MQFVPQDVIPIKTVFFHWNGRKNTKKCALYLSVVHKSGKAGAIHKRARIWSSGVFNTSAIIRGISGSACENVV